MSNKGSKSNASASQHLSPNALRLQKNIKAAFKMQTEKLSRKLEKNMVYCEVQKEPRKEPLKLEDCANFVGMILTKNKKLKKQLLEQAVLYGLDILDEPHSNIYEPN